MSGIDERKIYKVLRCQKCGSSKDIVLWHSNGYLAGWIVSEKDIQDYGYEVIIADTFIPEREVTRATCLICGTLDQTISTASIMFFKNKIRTDDYMTWESFREALRREREG